MVETELGDIMGAASGLVETAHGVPALFANGAEGDTAPASGGASGIALLAPLIAQKIVDDVRAGTTPAAESVTTPEMVDVVNESNG
jgi:hypothetical protein